VNVLLVSADPNVREMMALCVRGVRRLIPDLDLRFLEASDGVRGMKVAWAERPEVVVLDEITSRAGAFAVVKDLKGALPPLPAKCLILLDRPQDAWLARWSGADAWFDKPVNPFQLAEAVAGFLREPQKEAV
jgi:DNA-binding response OmpR family regulator